MLEFYLNTTSPQWFGLDGNPFRDNNPSMAFLSRDTVKIIACTETPEAGEENVDPTSWPRDVSWAAIPGIGAKITVDNDYIHKLKGTLATEVSAGSTASISATIENASYATVPASGTVRLFDASGNYEAIAYTARNISGNTVVFTTSGTLTGSYESGATMDCDQSPYCEAYLDTAQSNLEQGEFVFQLVVDSSRLREEMDYTNTARLDVQGLEMLVYKTVDGNDEPVKAYLCDTFSITGTIGNVGYEAEPPDPVKNQIAGIVNQLAAAGFEVEQQYDESGNTQFRFRSSSAGGTWSQWITVSKGEKGETGETGAAAGFGTPSVTVETLPAGSDATASVAASGDNTAKVFNFNLGIPRGADGKNGTDGADGAAGADGVSSYTYVAYASDASGTGFSLTPTNALKYRAEIHTTTAIETPDAEDFAGATWVKYLGDDGTGTGDMLKSVYDTDDDGIVDHAATAAAVGATTAAQVADAVGKAHTHANKATLDKLAETDGKLTFDGAEIGGGSGTVKSVNGQLPDESGNVTVETGGAVNESRLLPENPANGDIPCFDTTATVGGGNDANTKILLHFDADEIKDEAAGNAAPVTIKKKSGTITVVEGGKWGKCAKYVTGSMTVATNLDELNANNWVVSGWFNPDGTNHGVSYPAWLSMDDSSTNGFFFDSTGRYGESDGPLFYLDTPPAAGTWHWLAIVKYSGGLRFYLNGAFLNEISAQQRANFCSTLAIGGYAGTHAEGDTERTFSGLVDEVRLQYIPDDEITQWTGTNIAVPDAPYSKPQTVGKWGKLNKSKLVKSVNGQLPDSSGVVTLPAATASAAGLMAATDKAAIAGLTARGIYPVAGSKTGKVDFNEVIDHGFYFIGGDTPHLNYPETYAQTGGTLQVIRSGAYLTQTFIPIVSQSMAFIRHCINVQSDLSGRTFSTWRRLLTDAEITGSKARPGYFKLPGGMIVQWGAATITGDGLYQATFPIAFPNAIFIGNATAVSGTASASGVVISISELQTNRMTLITKNHPGSDQDINVHWLAIGY